MRWLFLVLMLSGCVYTPEKKVATEYILRPNGDGALTWIGQTYTSAAKDVGPVGDITGVDTTRIASWGITALSVNTLASPMDDTHELLWEDYQGEGGLVPGDTEKRIAPYDRIVSLKFRWAAIAYGSGNPDKNPYVYLDVYIGDVLIGRINVTAESSLSDYHDYSSDVWAIRETELDLGDKFTPDDIATLKTKLIAVVGTSERFNIYALECRAVTSEKAIEDVSGGEKKINTYVSIEKP